MKQSFFNQPLFSGHSKKIYGTSLKWFGSDILINYKEKGNLYGPEDIEYKFNNHGFRCDDFNIESKYRVVFIGCSVTQGIGLRLEETWAYKIYQNLKETVNHDIPFWNLSLGGAGLDALVRAYYHYHDMLKPQLVIAFFPAFRKEIYVKDCSLSSPPLFTLPNDDGDFLKNTVFLEDERNILYETEKNLAFLDLMLSKYSTKLLWTDWSIKEYPRDFPHRHNFMIEWDTKARDSMHPGSAAHLTFANNIWKAHKDMMLRSIDSYES